MEILRSVTQTVLGSQQNESQATGPETIEKLLDRVQSSTLLEDRRNGCRALKSLSKKYRVLVGAHGMDTLIQVLESDRNDHEIVNLALETLVNVTSDETFIEDGEEPDSRDDAQIGSQFTEIFTKRPENISMLISLLDEFDFKVRYPAMKLLNNLLKNRPKEIQEEILVIPSAISKLMDMLSDTREIIRNDTLPLLIELTKGNTSLQKIVAFENGFDHLFDIIKAEGYTDGGIVVEESLILTCFLLKNNPSNQILFKEGNYIQRMSEFFNFDLDGENIGWTAQKVSNVHYMMKLVCTLVSPHNSGQIIFNCQEKLRSCGLLQRLCSILNAVGVPADILSDTVVATSEVIRGNKKNQEFLSSIIAPSNPPRPFIVILLMSMLNDKQPFKLRCAMLYCFECFLYHNSTSQGQVIETLLPQTTDANQITTGQLLCGGLFSVDPLSNWFSAIALSHTLLDNTALKEHLLRAQVGTAAGGPPVSLLQRCTSLLQGSKILTRLAILQLLCVWVSHCPIAVSHLLSLPTVVPHLTAYLSANEHDEMEIICQGVCAFLLGLCCYFNDGSVSNFTKESLVQLIYNRVGVEHFSDKLSNILRTESYSRAAKSPQLNASHPSDIVFDIEFTKIFKHLEASALNAVSKSEMNSHEEVTVEITNYKNVIRDQDTEIRNLKDTLTKMEAEVTNLKVDLANKESSLAQVVEEPVKNGLANGTSCQLTSNSVSEDTSKLTERITMLEKQLAEITYARDYYYYQMLEKDKMLQTVSQQNCHAEQSELPDNAAHGLQMETMQKQLQDLQLALYKKDEEIQQIKELSCTPVETPSGSVCVQLENTTQSLSEMTAKNEILQKEIEECTMEKAQHVKVKEELERVQSSQEDLLVLLTDQDAKLREYKNRLRQLDQDFSDDDDDDDDLDVNDLL